MGKEKALTLHEYVGPFAFCTTVTIHVAYELRRG